MFLAFLGPAPGPCLPRRGGVVCSHGEEVGATPSCLGLNPSSAIYWLGGVECMIAFCSFVPSFKVSEFSTGQRPSDGSCRPPFAPEISVRDDQSDLHFITR